MNLNRVCKRLLCGLLVASGFSLSMGEAAYGAAYQGPTPQESAQYTAFLNAKTRLKGLVGPERNNPNHPDHAADKAKSEEVEKRFTHSLYKRSANPKHKGWLAGTYPDKLSPGKSIVVLFMVNVRSDYPYLLEPEYSTALEDMYFLILQHELAHTPPSSGGTSVAGTEPDPSNPGEQRETCAHLALIYADASRACAGLCLLYIPNGVPDPFRKRAVTDFMKDRIKQLNRHIPRLKECIAQNADRMPSLTDPPNEEVDFTCFCE